MHAHLRPLPFLALAALAPLLASCQTMTPEERRAADEQTCSRRYGFRPNTDGMSHCLLDLDMSRRADARATRYDSFDYPFWGTQWGPYGGYVNGPPVVIRPAPHRHP